MFVTESEVGGYWGKGEIFVSPKCSKVERRPGRVETGSGTDFEDFVANILLS